MTLLIIIILNILILSLRHRSLKKKGNLINNVRISKLNNTFLLVKVVRYSDIERKLFFSIKIRLQVQVLAALLNLLLLLVS